MFEKIFHGKAVLISGGSSGIGFAIASGFKDAGATVTVTGLTEGELAEAKAAGMNAAALDVGNLEACKKLMAGVERLDVLVNCAGMIRRANAEHDPVEFEQVINVNLNGTQRLCALARPLLAKTRGSIVNTASMRSFFGSAITPAYAASKGGVAQLTKSLAIAYADEGIRVNAIAPGWVATAGLPQKRARRARDGSSKSMWAARVVAMPPVSRPPMAFGWPVMEKGHAPGLPIRPVARWTLRIAEPLATPWAD